MTTAIWIVLSYSVGLFIGFAIGIKAGIKMTDKEFEDFEIKRKEEKPLREELEYFISRNLGSTTYEGYDHTSGDVEDFLVNNRKELIEILKKYTKP